MVRKLSFISNALGRDTYDNFKEFARPAAIIGTIILVLLYILSHNYHSDIISLLLSLTNGFSLLFIGYIIVLIVSLDYEVEVDVPKSISWREIDEIAKPFKYKLTTAWTVLLLISGIIAMFYSYKYQKHYSFECDTFWVDKNAGIYHYDWNDDCERAKAAESLAKMKGYQIEKSYKLCEECKVCEEELAP